MTITKYSLVIAIAVYLTGCSMVIAGGGLDEEKIFKNDSDRKSIEKYLGEPLAVRSLDPPRSPRVEVDHGKLVPTSVATYEYIGRLYDPLAFQDLGMLVGMTLGLGEFKAFPEAKQRAKAMEAVYRFQVWYTADARYIFYTRNRYRSAR